MTTDHTTIVKVRAKYDLNDWYCEVCGCEVAYRRHKIPGTWEYTEPKWEHVDSRPFWDPYFTSIAEGVAQRATCNRAKVGAVLVSPDHRILATGYNGSAPGEPHCLDVGCDIVDGHCQRVQHAEVNAVAFAARYGVPIAGSRLYLWIGAAQGEATVASVCRECAKVLRAAGVQF